MFFSSSLLLLAAAAGTLANPLFERGPCADACCADVTGGPIDEHIRSSHCASFLIATVTPAPVTVTATVYTTCTDPFAAPTACKPKGWKRDVTTGWPDAVPTYATACSGSIQYSSACACFGFTKVVTTTVDPPTTTWTAYHTPGLTCDAATTVFKFPGSTFTCAPKTVTVTSPGWYSSTTSGGIYSSTTSGFKRYTSASFSHLGGPFGSFTCPTATVVTTTVTVTATYTTTTTTTTATTTSSTTTTTTTPSATPTFCLTDDDATTIVNGFINFLTNTGDNFDTALADTLLADDFTDTSDSINFLASIPLGTFTFDSKDNFITGQGGQPAVASVTTLNIWHDCNIITWRWVLLTGLGANLPVQGINVMLINDDKQIDTNYSEFDNAAWLVDLGNPECASNTTTSTTKRRRDLDTYLLKRRLS